MALMVGVTCATTFHFTCASAMANPQLKGTGVSPVRMRDCGAGILSQCLPPHVTKHLGYITAAILRWQLRVVRNYWLLPGS